MDQVPTIRPHNVPNIGAWDDQMYRVNPQTVYVTDDFHVATLSIWLVEYLDVLTGVTIETIAFNTRAEAATFQLSDRLPAGDQTAAIQRVKVWSFDPIVAPPTFTTPLLARSEAGRATQPSGTP